MGVWSVNHFDRVCVARAAVHPGRASACAGVAALLGGTMKLGNCSLAHGRLKEECMKGKKKKD